ncbi:MAG: DUF1775 domain-containing protein, partial [Vicinamibacterales bacterium]
MRRLTTTVVLVVALASVVSAHVTVWPRESAPGASERYTVRVPTEGKVATMSIDLEVPPNVTVTSVLAMSGVTTDIARDGARITAVTWKFEVPPGQFAEFVFMARNPKEPGEIAWKVHQHFADGS